MFDMFPNYAYSSTEAVFLGMSANMAVPLADSKFFELVFANSVCGFDLGKC
jgi:hypothetical protein